MTTRRGHWMRDLEDGVIPTIGRMMMDEPMSLDIPQQWIIAQWALKCAMVFEYVNKHHQVFYTAEERVALRTSGVLPPSTAVWIARSLGINTFYTKGNRGDSITDVAEVEGYITTIAYRRFVVQAATVRFLKRDETANIVFDGNDATWHDANILIWPPRTMANWPNRMSIAPGAIDRFHRRFAPDDMGLPH